MHSFREIRIYRIWLEILKINYPLIIKAIKKRIKKRIFRTSLVINHSSFFLVLFFFLTCSCQRNNSTGLNAALILAENNRPELEKVLVHYSKDPADSLKYRAACFLIENMPYYHYYEGKSFDNYLQIFEVLATSKQEPQAVLDSFISEYGNFSINQLERKPDIKEIKYSYLIENIEWAFKVWKEQPWGKNVSFDDFCEYILPYRIEDEQPSEWREKMYEKYNYLLDTYRNSPEAKDPLFAAKIILDSLSKGEKHFTTVLPNLPHIGPELCEQWRTGSCRELTDLTVYVLRSLGIPCGIDFMPIHGRGNAGHFWTFILDINRNTYTSDYLDAEIGILSSHEAQHLTSKVYRKMFSINKKLEKQLYALSTSVPPFFSHPRYIDITSLYTGKNPVRSISIPESAWYVENKSPSIVYLCVSQKDDWVPVAWTQFHKKNTQFDNIKSDIVFRIASWESNQLKFQTDPFRITGLDGKIQLLVANEKNDSICLLSKFDVGTEGFTGLMVNGVFEASNNGSFNCPDTLSIINKPPVRLKNAFYMHSQKKYRYIRYKGPEGSHCDVSEVMFYKNINDTKACLGKVIGTPNNDTINNKHEYPNAFDGNPYTSFHYKNASGGWVGLDFGMPVSISKIIYIPRNRDNFIRKGDQYELYYLDKEWISAGEQIAEADSLVYKNIVSGTLLYLKNHTRGNDERIFTYGNGKQIWW